MADFLDEKRKEIQARLKELKPLVEEYHKLEAADLALGGLGNGTPAASRPPHPPGAAAPRARRGTRGRPKGGGTRAAQALQLVSTARASPSPSSPRRWASSRTTSTA